MLSCSNNDMNDHNLHPCNCTNQYICYITIVFLQCDFVAGHAHSTPHSQRRYMR